MDRKKKPGKMSVPQFGGWEHKAPGVPTDYSMVFSQARANKKSQKTDLAEVKRISVGNDQKFGANNANYRHGNDQKVAANNANYRHHHPPRAPHPHDDPPVLRRNRVLNYMYCCRPPSYDK